MNDLTRIIRECERHGLRYEPRGRYPKLVNPTTGRSISVASTPRCPHAHKNVLRDVRKYLGVEITT
jgi:hypothetical protein